MTKPKPKRARQLGVTDAEYKRLLEAQNGGCALCGRPPKTRRLHVDHDHATSEIRGLLCFVCNRFLPASRDADWHRKAADYLGEQSPAPYLDSVLRRLQPYTMRR